MSEHGTDQPRPDWWNALHDAALISLTEDWRDFSDLDHGKVVLDDLVAARLADVEQVNLFTRGIASGCQFAYRVGTGHQIVRPV